MVARVGQATVVRHTNTGDHKGRPYENLDLCRGSLSAERRFSFWQVCDSAPYGTREGRVPSLQCLARHHRSRGDLPPGLAPSHEKDARRSPPIRVAPIGGDHDAIAPRLRRLDLFDCSGPDHRTKHPPQAVHVIMPIHTPNAHVNERQRKCRAGSIHIPSGHLLQLLFNHLRRFAGIDRLRFGERIRAEPRLNPPRTRDAREDVRHAVAQDRLIFGVEPSPPARQMHLVLRLVQPPRLDPRERTQPVASRAVHDARAA